MVEVGHIESHGISSHQVIWPALDIQHLPIERGNHTDRVHRRLGSIDPGLGSSYILSVRSILEAIIGALGICQLRLLQRKIILRFYHPIFRSWALEHFGLESISFTTAVYIFDKHFRLGLAGRLGSLLKLHIVDCTV